MAAGDHTQARLQRIEDEVRELRGTVAVLAAVDDVGAKERIESTFGSDPRMVIIYRGVQAGLTQTAIGAALKSRGLEPSLQQRVSDSLVELEKRRFIDRPAKGLPTVVHGWGSFGLERALKKTLKSAGVSDL